MTTRAARSCAYCDELEGDLLRVRTRLEALRLRVRGIAERMARERDSYTSESDDMLDDGDVPGVLEGYLAELETALAEPS